MIKSAKKEYTFSFLEALGFELRASHMVGRLLLLLEPLRQPQEYTF
jgi:hypothetical protein